MNNKIKKIYWAGDLWNFKDLIGNELLVQQFNQNAQDKYEAVLPQNVEATTLDKKSIRDADFELLFSCDAIVCNFDGDDLDSGTVAEFCFAKVLDLPAVLFRSDFRNNNDGITCPDPWNLMLSNYPRTKTLLMPAMPILPQIGSQNYLTKAANQILNALDEVFNIPQLYQSKEEYFNLYPIALKSAGPSLEKLFPTNRIKEIIDNRFL